jgi:hypothetical protein
MQVSLLLMPLKGLLYTEKKWKAYNLPFLFIVNINYFLAISSLTVNFFLALALLLDNIWRPVEVAILSRNPCLFLLFLFEG